MGYGRFISSGLVALSLAANLEMPYMGAAEFKDQCGSTDALTTWAEKGYHPRGTLTWIDPDLAAASQPLMTIAEVDHNSGGARDDPTRVNPSQPLMIITEQRAAIVLQRRYRGSHSSSPPAASTTKKPRPSPWLITRETQVNDPYLRRVISSLEAKPRELAAWAIPRRAIARIHRQNYLMRHGVVYFLDGEGERKLVPSTLRQALLTATHTSPQTGGHRGAKALYRQLTGRYYWPGMYGDCEQCVLRCERCRSMNTARLPNVRSEPKVEPPHPFHTIHIDHKRLVPSGDSEFEYLLIVVCALTRWTIAIPVVSTTSDEVCRALYRHVFQTFSFPVQIVADNAFRAKALSSFARYAGFRMIHILPNNPQSNGLAEATVKRVASLLVRHCRELSEWHKMVPMICHALNSSVHSGTLQSPFFALFGRKPICVPELEDPQLRRVDVDGNEFTGSLAARLRLAWEAIRTASYELKKASLDRASIGKRRWSAPATPTSVNGIQVGDRVMVRHGDAEKAARQRKHGEPAMRTFRVVRVIPEAGAIEIDSRKTGMRPVISVRHAEKVPDHWWIFDDGSGTSGQSAEFTTLADAWGKTPRQIGEVMNCPLKTAKVYQVIDVSAARKRKGSWWYLVQFQGYKEQEWVRDKHLEDAGTWVQNQMTTVRLAGTAKSPPSEAGAPRRSPRLAQVMNELETPPPLSAEETWINSQSDYEVLGM